ncbi:MULTISPECIES: hypothetical protein [Streptomyces]|uniref:Uncharacterized protein n=2 Tax=Streptomyces griseoaurantiacus TaxID=68213 RepID=F3NLX3_9ACTN|nr:MULTISPECIES: hypothetical protein [Streptomyces]EGG45523.1 hypothetical protein SGM_4228 [Streptomyces griseoaurantiacus M045]MDX3087674.1 hypothetical protein [Streptomyces sp. ME12-02E]MDX3331146.1 hypothetical protein [Streptomyces sp. ME02-6978a]MDX3361039.1 hypothetical protein [Streptomyces sp. ME02-6978.2a]NJP73262.1 hypothetical protein [Streptomyces sp. C1-2]
MGWTHDYNDVARNRRSAAGPGPHERGAPQLAGADPRVGIPHILRRRARWVSARLRHARG